MVTGHVSLVGAGPGDPYLLTLAGFEAIGEADCVVYDKLVNPRILDFASESAERIFVGKEAGNRYMPQEEINQLLVDLARSGKQVVRLKGGDPLIFARGAEEIDALAAAGVDYQIIPGVTAALGAAASASIPLTHRKYSSSVTFVTGHDDPEKGALVDWSQWARQSGTIVVYMARAKMTTIVHQLLAAGMPPETPIAFIQWGGSNLQKVHTTMLADAATGVPEQIGTPMLAIIGSVVSERAVTAWLERRPLFGRTVLMLRTRKQSMAAARKLEKLGANVISHPAIQISPPVDWDPIDRAIHALAVGDWLIFTSSNGVEFFLSRFTQIGLDMRSLAGVGIAAIGPGTAAALSMFHLRPDLVPPEFRSESLVESLKPRVAGRRVILVRADRGREILEQQLRAFASAVEQIAVYRQTNIHAAPESLLKTILAGQLDYALLTSGNIARGFFHWLDEPARQAVRRSTKLASISPVTSDVIRNAGFEVSIEATEYSMDGLIKAVVEAELSAR